MVTAVEPSARTADVPATQAWRRWRVWVALAAAVVLGAVLVASVTSGPGRALDPSSAHPNGSRALAQVLRGYGVGITPTSSVADALSTAPSTSVVVTSPDAYSATQLRSLAAAAGRLVLVAPGSRAVGAVLAGVSPDPGAEVSTAPECSAAGAQAAGDVDLPAGAVGYTVPPGSSVTRCYDGVVLLTPRLVVLGSADLLRNDTLGHTGVAALDVNALSGDRSLRRVTWLLAGSDAAGSGPASVWDLFPDGVHRAFVWLIVLGLLVVVWRARRLGGVVREPLPVVVRSSEVVEGHGRLYLRAGARDRAAAALRTALRHRLAARLALPRATTPEQLANALSPRVGRSAAELAGLLAGPPPRDDAGLVGLATELDRLEAATGGLTDEGTTPR